MPGSCAAHGGVVSHAWAAQDASDCTPSQPQTIARDACLERWRLCPPRLQTASTASSVPIAPALKFKPALSILAALIHLELRSGFEGASRGRSPRTRYKK